MVFLTYIGSTYFVAAVAYSTTVSVSALLLYRYLNVNTDSEEDKKQKCRCIRPIWNILHSSYSVRIIICIDIVFLYTKCIITCQLLIDDILY